MAALAARDADFMWPGVASWEVEARDGWVTLGENLGETTRWLRADRIECRKRWS